MHFLDWQNWRFQVTACYHESAYRNENNAIRESVMNHPNEQMRSGDKLRLLILGNAKKPQVRQEAERLLPFLKERATVVVFDLY